MYARSRGIVPIEDRMKPFYGSLDEEKKKSYESLCKELSPLEEALKETYAVGRLHGLWQLNGKTSPFEDTQVSRSPAFHSRFQHSELIAAYIKFAGANMGLSAEELRPAIMAAWMHDTGHSAFSHLGDELLIERGRMPHEERSVAHLKDADIVEILNKENISVEETKKYLYEKGSALGALQSACDTLSYLTLDTKSSYRGEYMKDEGFAFLSSVQGIDREQNMLIVQNEEAAQELIETRARMYKELYYHPINKRADEAMRQLLRIALNHNLITLDDLENGIDTELRLTIQSLVQNDPGAAKFSVSDTIAPVLKEYKDLYTMSLGFDAPHWERQTFDTEEQAIKALTPLSRRAIEQSFIIKPFDYTKKKLPFLKYVDDTLVPYTVQANKTELRDEDRKYIIYFPRLT